MTLRSQLPTSRADWYRTVTLAGTVVSHPGYAALAAVVGFSNTVVFIAARNARLVWDVVLFGPQSLATRVSVFVNLLPIVGSGLDSTSEAILLVFGMLAGVTFAAVVLQLRRKIVTTAAGTGVVGVVLGGAGVGCAACGIPLLAVVTGIGGAGVIAALPFGGNEFAVLGTVLLVLSLFWLTEDGVEARSANGPE